MCVILYIISVVVFTLVSIGFYQKSTNATCKSRKRLDGKTAIVSGGTAGMGLEIAKEFANRGGRVIIACPYEEEGENAKKTIVEETGNRDVIFKLLDLSSIASIRKFVNEILEVEERLDILVNNAGTGPIYDYITKDGMSFIMQVNYFGHWLITVLLLPLLMKTGKASAPARIVNVTSLAQYFGKVDFERLNDIKYWYPTVTYGNSKVCFLLFTRHLSKMLKGSNVVVNDADPGVVGTKIYKCGGNFLGNICTFLGWTFSKTPWEGAQTAMHVSLDDKAGTVSGEMFWNCKLSRARSIVNNEELARKVWDVSVNHVGITKEELAFLIDHAK